MEKFSLSQSAELPERSLTINRIRLLSLLCGMNACTPSFYQADTAPRSELFSSESSEKCVNLETATIYIPSVETVEVEDPSVYQPPPCPEDMVKVRDEYCVDRFETVLVNGDGNLMSPYLTPDPEVGRKQFVRWTFKAGQTGGRADMLTAMPEINTWQFEDSPLRSMSALNQVPNGYMTQEQAIEACRNAGKRLCTSDEWVTACRGEDETLFPYGNKYEEGRCNVAQPVHPARVLTGSDGINLDDPRLNLFEYKGETLLRKTGHDSGCVSPWGDDGIYDMVGNLSEWIGDRNGFRGGPYVRENPNGCFTLHGGHAENYYDYSIGARCCKDINQ